jgi:transcriptional regulator with XRE-family HTH domain
MNKGINKSRLKGKLAENGLSQREAAEMIGISLGAFNQKLIGKSDFTSKELKQLCEITKASADYLLDLD